MITIIPNWHPILVHFTIGLLSISVLFYFAERLLPIGHRWKEQWLHMANWSLWTGCAFTLMTVLAGWHAYNTVVHDAASHEAMTLHRNWALATACIFLIVGISAAAIARESSRPKLLFLSVSAVAAILLMITGWLGSEAVYRYGLGVMSLPVVESGADSHNHSRHGTPQNEVGVIQTLQSHPHTEEHTSDTPTATESKANNNDHISHEGEHHH
jgi:uncharacterized membrane protein